MAQVSHPPPGKPNLNAQESTAQQYQEIPVLYLWFGKTVPEDYLISLSELNYPIIFLKNPKIQRNFSRQLFDVQKSDYYRLWYLYEHGGLYSDFDNTIDYPCLMKILEPYQTQDNLVFMTDNRHTREKTQQITTNLIFAPYPKMPILKKMLDSIDETKQQVWQFAGTKFVGQFSEPIEMQMGQCIQHSYDWSWFEASNSVLGLTAEAHPHYAKKLMKKKDFITEKEKLDNQMVEQKSYNKYLQAQILEKSHEKAQFREQVKELHKKVLQVCPSAEQMIQSFQSTLNTAEGQSSEPNQINLSKRFKEEKDQQVKIEEQQRANLWRRINRLQLRNEKLQYQKGIYELEVYGSIGIMILALVFAIIMGIKNQKRKFKKVSTQQQRSTSFEE